MLPTYLNTLQVSVYKNCTLVLTSSITQHHLPLPCTLSNTYILHYLLATATPPWLFSLKKREPCHELHHEQHSITLHKNMYNCKTLYKRSLTHLCMHLQGTRPTHNEVLIAFTRGMNTSVPSNYFLTL